MSIALQICGECGAAQYPSRDICRQCLCDALKIQELSVEGRIMAVTQLHRSLDPDRLSDGPLRIGIVASALGIRVIAALAPDAGIGAAVRLVRSTGPGGPILAVPLHSGGPKQVADARSNHEN